MENLHLKYTMHQTKQYVYTTPFRESENQGQALMLRWCLTLSGVQSKLPQVPYDSCIVLDSVIRNRLVLESVKKPIDRVIYDNL